MSNKYWVPSLEKANNVLWIIANHPGELRLIDISKETGINKSSLYSLLNTLEDLNWVEKKRDKTYYLGTSLFNLSSLYTEGSNIVDIFLEESSSFVEDIKETMQISKLDETDVLYLAKKEGNASVRMTTQPGMKIPAHTTAMGKALLSDFSLETLKEIYLGKKLEARTANSVNNLEDLYEQILFSKKNGYIVEHEEAVEGFNCISSPIRNKKNQIIAAVSVTIPTYNWEKKHEKATQLIKELAEKISFKAKNISD